MYPRLLRRASRWALVLAKGQVHQNVTGWQRGAQAVVTTTDRFADVLVERGIDRVEVVRNGTDLNAVRAQHERVPGERDRKSTRLNSSHVAISYAVFCLKKKKKANDTHRHHRQ